MIFSDILCTRDPEDLDLAFEWIFEMVMKASSSGDFSFIEETFFWISENAEHIHLETIEGWLRVLFPFRHHVSNWDICFEKVSSFLKDTDHQVLNGMKEHENGNS